MLSSSPHLPRIENADLSSKRVLLRIEAEPALDHSGAVSNPLPLLNILPTIHFLLQRKASVLILSHASHPQNKKPLDLEALAKYLGQLLEQKVGYAASSILKGEGEQRPEKLFPQPVTLLENLDFYPGEKKGEQGFAAQLSKLGEVYVNEARSANSQKYASLTLLPKLLPSYAGLGLYGEWEFLQSLMSKNRLHLVLGGLRLAEKLELIKKLISRIDSLMIAGGLSYNFMRSRAMPVGRSLCEEELDVPAFQLMERAELEQVHTILPIDHALAKHIRPDASCKISARIPEDLMGLDIGPKTLGLFEKELKQASNILWYGPLGVTELKKFSWASCKLAKFLAKSKAPVCAIGKDTTELIHSMGKAGAYEYLEPDSHFVLDVLKQKAFPGLLALSKQG